MCSNTFGRADLSSAGDDPLPAGIVLHLPHDSIVIPDEVKDHYLLDQNAMAQEVCRMTDHLTRRLYAGNTLSGNIVVAMVSRLVVDVERFPDDDQEPMSSRGMGAIYQLTSSGQKLRRPLSQAERQFLLDHHYTPHHARLEAVVRSTLEQCGHCLILDAHSFPSRPLPYEENQDPNRPDICIGTDAFHTSTDVREAFANSFRHEGFKVDIDRPFAGSIVPFAFYRRDANVRSVMIEVNRGLYLNEATGQANAAFETISSVIRRAWREAFHTLFPGANR